MVGIDGITSGLNINTAGWGSTLGTITVAILWIAVAVAVLFGLIYLLSFNVKVGINEKNGNEGYITRWEKGRFKKDKKNGLMIFQTLKDKRWKQPLDKRYVSVQRKSFGMMGRMVYFAEDEEGRLQPIRPVAGKDLAEWTGWDNDDVEFAASAAREVIEMVKKQDFWAKYGTLIMWGAFAMVFVMALVLFRQMNGITEQLGNVAGALERASAGFNTAVITNGTQVIVG